MTVGTHCLPSGSLQNHQVGVPQFPGMAPITAPSSGGIRGVVVELHGIHNAPQSPVWSSGSLGDAGTLAADGWVVIHAITPGDDHPLGQGVSLFFDVQSDSGHGSRHANTYGLWWDHVVRGIDSLYGAGIPKVVHGFSWGGLGALQVAIQRTSTIVAYLAHHPVSNLSLLTNPSPVFTSLTATGIIVPSTGLNALGVNSQGNPCPGLLGWGTIDTIVDNPQSGDNLTPAIYAAALAAGQPVSPNCNGSGASSGGTPEAHVVSTADKTTWASFFTTVIDPVCPKAF